MKRVGIIKESLYSKKEGGRRGAKRGRREKLRIRNGKKRVIRKL